MSEGHPGVVRGPPDPGAPKGIRRSFPGPSDSALHTVLAPSLFERTALARPAALLLVLGTLACSGGSADSIDREVFIATYVDLRMAALETDSARIGIAERDEILQRHGVSADDMKTFTEVHSGDLDFMRDVWNEVEVRMDVEPEDDEGDRP